MQPFLVVRKYNDSEQNAIEHEANGIANSIEKVAPSNSAPKEEGKP
jgi:hypothetical protein